jgi:hypothetical protein
MLYIYTHTHTYIYKMVYGSTVTNKLVGGRRFERQMVMSFGLLSIRPNMLLITFIHLEVPPDSRDRGITDPRGLHVAASVWMWAHDPVTCLRPARKQGGDKRLIECAEF